MKTRMESARLGTLTGEMEEAAHREGLTAEQILAGISQGTLVLTRNRKREIPALAVGGGTRVKINANIGTSPAQCDVNLEIAKMKTAVENGADAVMDLSTGGPIDEIRKRVLAECPVAIGTVPIYEATAENEAAGNLPHQMSSEDIFKIVERHCAQGVDFLTLHCGINRQSADVLLKANRLTGVVSRGGALLLEWMTKNNKENPLYENFDELLNILAEYDVTISLGDGFRPGSLNDATDAPQIEELRILGELVERCRERGVQSIVEGPGHVPLHEVETNIRLQKALCKNAPFYVLGPLVTDVSPGYDHIAGAIGGAVAAMAGADFLCYLTPAEHLRLPSLEDVKEGMIASRIAAHAADVARGLPGARAWDDRVSHAKARLDWAEMIKHCLDPQKASKYRESLRAQENELCSMCGKFCAMKRSAGIKKLAPTK